MTKKIDSIRYIAADTAVMIDNTMWISNRNYNGLYCWKVSEQRATFVEAFPGEKRDEWRLHSASVCLDKKIYFFPDRAKCIHVYDTEKKAFNTIELYCQERLLTRFAFSYDKYIVFALGRPKACICMLDTTNNSIRYFYNREEKVTFSRDYVLCNDSVWFVTEGSNQINEFSLTKKEYILHEINDELLYTVALAKDDFIIGSLSGAIRWNSENGIVKEYDGFPDSYKFVSLQDEEIVKQDVNDEIMKGESPFSLSFSFGNEELLFPNRTNAILKVDENGMSLSDYKIEEESITSLNQPFRITHSRFTSIYRSEEMVVLFSSLDRSFYFYNISFGNCEIKRAFAKEPFDLGEYLMDTKQDLFYEDEYYYQLSDFIRII